MRVKSLKLPKQFPSYLSLTFGPPHTNHASSIPVVFCIGIRTHKLSIMSLLLVPLSHCSRPTSKFCLSIINRYITQQKQSTATTGQKVFCAVVVAQLAEQLLLMPEVRGSNPGIGKIYNEHVNC